MNESNFVAAVTISVLLTTNVVYKYPQVREKWWRGDGQYLLNANATVYIAPPTIDDPNAKERWRVTNVTQTTTVKSANWQFVTNQVVWSSSPVREVLVSHWEEEIKGLSNVSMKLNPFEINWGGVTNRFNGQVITTTEPAEMPITKRGGQ